MFFYMEYGQALGNRLFFWLAKPPIAGPSHSAPSAPRFKVRGGEAGAAELQLGDEALEIRIRPAKTLTAAIH
jgi:hypothetical protein